MLVDLGSNINIIVNETANIFAEKSRQHWNETKTLHLKDILYVSGVGKGATPCRTAAKLTIACAYEGQAPGGGHTHTTQIDTFMAYVAEGCGENLPAILGLNSMQKKRCILILEDGKERIIFPGDHTYKI